MKIYGNTWMRLHGYPMTRTKRYAHERKDLPKELRVKYHARRKAGCNYEYLQRFLGAYAR